MPEENMKIRLFPSLMASRNQLEIASQIKLLEPWCDGFHLDIADDHFVSTIAFGVRMVEEIAVLTKSPLWIHLMVENPKLWIDRLKNFSNRIMISIHMEVVPRQDTSARQYLDQFITIFQDVGVTLDPEADPERVRAIGDLVSHVSLMGVYPGRSGQKFLQTTWNKIKEISQLRKSGNFSYRIGIDGGITLDLFQPLVEEGVTDFVLGSSVFSAPDIIQAIKQFKNAQKK
jgi:ribulose-phosphate 3-epimerase